jgi:CHAT domain-containing protein/tetratricopeptide (TPR) repeat protein
MLGLFLCKLMLAGLAGQGQVSEPCPTDLQVHNRLLAIEGNTTAANEEKLKQLHHLRQLYSKCHSYRDSTFARIVHRLGGIYSLTGDMEKAVHFTKEAVAVNNTAKKKADRSFLANSYFNLGTFYGRLYLAGEAQQSLDSCISISLRYPAKHFLALMALEQKAYAFFQTGDYQKSMETAERGILLARVTRNLPAESSLLSQKAQAQLELKQLPEAGQNLRRAIHLQSGKGANPNHLATSYSVYARLASLKKDRKAAVGYYRQAFEINKSQGNWRQCSRDLLDLGYLYDTDLQDAASAMACFKQGLKLLEKAPDDYQKAAININMGVVYWRQKDYDQALKFYQKALNALPIQFADTALLSNPTVPMLRLVTNDYFVSTVLSNKAEALLEKYKITKRKDHLSAALQTYRLADKAVDLMRWKQYGEQSKLFWRQQTREMYGHALEACFLAQDANQAFFFMEKSRAVLLNDKLNELGAFSKLPAAEIAIDRTHRIKVISAQQKWASTAPGTRQSLLYQGQWLQAKDNFDSYIRSLEKKYPAYYQYKYQQAVPSLKQLQQHLAKDKASFVYYFMSDSSAYVLSITPLKTQMIRLSDKQFDLKGLSRFHALCSGKNNGNARHRDFALLSNKLYKTLIQPLQLPKGRVIVCTDNFLIPFEALSTDRQGNRYLIRDYAFSYVYSTRYLLKDFKTGPAKGNFIGFAPVHFKPHLQLHDLKKATFSLRQTAGFYSHRRLVTGQEATKSNFIGNMGQYTIVHVFSHARADTPADGPLLFMQDSAIRVGDLQFPLDPATRLVVLSACQTHVGKQAAGEGIYSLARGFSAAGIPAVAATLWKADEQAIYEISRMFHKNLAQGKSKDVALQEAKLSYLADNGLEKSLPYFWANMILTGNAGPIELARKPAPNWAIGLGALVLTGFIIFIFKNRNRLTRAK